MSKVREIICPIRLLYSATTAHDSQQIIVTPGEWNPRFFCQDDEYRLTTPCFQTQQQHRTATSVRSSGKTGLRTNQRQLQRGPRLSQESKIVYFGVTGVTKRPWLMVVAQVHSRIRIDPTRQMERCRTRTEQSRARGVLHA